MCVLLGARAPAMVANTGQKPPTYQAEKEAPDGSTFSPIPGRTKQFPQTLPCSATRGPAGSPPVTAPRHSLRSRGDVSFFTYLPCTSAGLDTSFLVFLRDSILTDDARRRRHCRLPSSLARAARPPPAAASSRAAAASASALRRPRPPASSAACWRRYTRPPPLSRRVAPPAKSTGSATPPGAAVT